MPMRLQTAPRAMLQNPLAAMLALVLGIGLLCAFSQVVQQAVLRGAALRMETSLQADATWRCGSSKGAQARADCRDALLTTRTAKLGSTP